MAKRGELDDLRDEIDRIDRRILSHLDERMSLVQRIREVKETLGLTIHDPARETEIIARLVGSGPRLLRSQDIEEIWAALFRTTRSAQGERKTPGLLCISVRESEPHRASERMRAGAGEGDLVELRLDALKPIRLDGLLPFAECPLIVTNRRRAEGGLFPGNEEERLSHLMDAIRCKATYVDMEWRTPEPMRSRLLGDKAGTKVILSYHDLQGTPPLSGLLSLWEEMTAVDADGYKIVTRAQHLDDSMTVLRFLREVAGGGRPVISHCMGEEGRISRVLAPLFGSWMAYAAPSGGAQSAPGQLTAGQMRRVWEVVGG